MFGVLVLVVTLTVGYALHLWNRYKYWQRRGVPTLPISHWLLGHAQDVQRDKKSVDNLYTIGEQLNTKTYGLYEGGHKTLVTSDLDLINDIFVKKFEHFHGRKLPMFVAIDQDTDSSNADLLGSQGLRWKRLRTIMNPSFTTGKLRHFEPTILDSIEHFIDLLKKKSGQEQDIWTPLNRLTMDVIYRIAFGRRTSKLYGEVPEEIIKIASTVFNADPIDQSALLSFFAGTYDFLPVTRHLFKVLAKLVKDPFQSMRVELTREIENRYKMMERGETVPGDYIQMFIEAQADEDEEEEFSAQLTASLERTHLKVNKKMTQEEIIGQCTVFLLAGYDTTANAMSFFIYEMAENPEIQERLYEEIMSVCPTKDDVTGENTKNTPYLDRCLKESLRKNPHVGLICARKCTKDCTVAGGLQIEKNTDIRANVKAIHYDKELWGEDVEKFNPDRFEPDAIAQRNPLAFMAFGTGPRMCIGMRLALLEEKLTLVRLLQEFRIEISPSTKMNAFGLMLTQTGELILRLVPRN